jgi:hypothetical protein
MARDGFLPRALAGPDDAPPLAAVVLQGALALLILVTHPLQEILQNLGAILMLSATLTAAALFRVRFTRTDLPRPSVPTLLAAGVFVASSVLLLAMGVQASWRFAAWIALALALAAIAFRLSRREAAA